ncbi:PKD domain-containing protein [Hymenobacter aerilatus]|uniref:PKD domain-containing protein n=1 Tax=Hymenobacter aerilatus TaxID=2932251 RepID=A0A8T9SVG2_9BACT|nr:PKD domain-containing protein [Hymenobacter aerilatus]UOR06058.1 PKD domain-containing protein [Hymenobacter aerilatus]
MKTTWNKAVTALLISPLLFTACDKNEDGQLEGPLPAASFTSTVNSTQFPVTVTFTSTSENDFVSGWEFGDGTVGSGSSVTHTYNTPGTYKVRLNVSGRGGFAATPQADVVVPTACGNTGFSALVACNGGAPAVRVWTLSNAAGAIKRLDASNNVTSSSAANALASCQADDQFSFSGSSFTYTYTANNACGTEASGSSGFVYKPGSGGSLGQIVLGGTSTFIGENVAVPNRTYDIIEASNTILRLRGTLANGTKTEVTLVPFDAVTRVKQLLTGGTQKTWMLDNAVEKTITVGTESNPTEYYGGGSVGALPACQADDEFTFSAADIFTYNAKDETFVAGSPGSCQTARSGTSAYTFGPADGAGLAQLVFAKAGTFIGITDAPDLTYRILSITDKNMVIRAGTGKNKGTVFDIKLIAK